MLHPELKYMGSEYTPCMLGKLHLAFMEARKNMAETRMHYTVCLDQWSRLVHNCCWPTGSVIWKKLMSQLKTCWANFKTKKWRNVQMKSQCFSFDSTYFKHTTVHYLWEERSVKLVKFVFKIFSIYLWVRRTIIRLIIRLIIRVTRVIGYCHIFM